MDFGLSEDQRLLEETLRSFLADQVPITRVRELREASCPNDRSLWKTLAELGMTGVLIPEEHGGSGLSLLDASLVAQSLGHAATPAPFLSSARSDRFTSTSTGWRETILLMPRLSGAITLQDSTTPRG